MNNIPSRNNKFIGDDGYLTLAWWMFLNSFVTKPMPESSITPTGSPFSYTAQTKGQVLVQGGTVSQIQLKRITAHTLGFIDGLVNVGQGDIVIVTYSGTPTMVFFPA